MVRAATPYSRASFSPRSARRSARRATRMTAYPSSAHSLASSAPMPLEAPVIRAAPLAMLFLLFQRLVVLLDKLADLVRHGQQLLPLFAIQSHGEASHSI